MEPAQLIYTVVSYCSVMTPSFYGLSWWHVCFKGEGGVKGLTFALYTSTLLVTGFYLSQ